MAHVKMIWAQDRNGAIGKDNRIPWDIPEDLSYFKSVTQGSSVIMGRNTWLSLPKNVRPLPGRRNVVLSSKPDSFDHEGAELFATLAEAVLTFEENESVWVMGGAGIYHEALPYAEQVHITEVDLYVDEADTFAPKLTGGFYRLGSDDWQTSKKGIDFMFTKYQQESPRKIR